MNVEEKNRGLFLSEEGYTRAKKIYSTKNSDSSDRIQENILSVGQILFDSNLDSFDDFYVAIYTISLYGHGITFNKAASEREIFSRDRLHKYTLKIVMDVNITKPGSKNSFLESLIDEFQIASVFNCLNTIKNTLPYKANLEKIGAGCVWIEFGIYVEKSRIDRDQEIPFLEKNVIESDANSGPQSFWQFLKNRYPIGAMELTH